MGLSVLHPAAALATASPPGSAPGEPGNKLGEWLSVSIPIALTVAFLVAFLVGLRIALRRQAQGKSDTGFHQQLTMFIATLFAVVILILNLPIEKDTRSELLRLFGLLLSGAIALSSTTILGNMMAGLMLRSVRGFRPGDFLRCGDTFGRVTERGLLHTEVQTEQSELTTLPNLYLVTTPYTVIRAGGTIVEARVSLGYDVPRTRAEQLLIQAADSLELEQPFVHILELGDFSVTYRVGGLLREIKHLLSVRSKLRGAMLDSLHHGGVEVASPTLMSTRAFDKRDAFVPPARPAPTAQAEDEGATFEDVAFEKADRAATIEEIEASLGEVKEELASARESLRKAKGDDERESLLAEVERLTKRVERQSARLQKRREELSEDDT
ncbi:MAG TPA: mechanosensitive ion channel [Planctomycetes bacterium]|nr:mechanosensitive ion channel [Planctomycetota bacterium]